MTRPSADKKKDAPAKPDGITKISVAGFKSIVEEQSIEVRPLTILAGANSSGKSSIMQPLLLLKQTLEASYDPGALRLDGPNVRFTSAEQFLSRVGRGKHTDTFSVGLKARYGYGLTTYFKKQPGKSIEVQSSILSEGVIKNELRPNMTSEEIRSNLDPHFLTDVTLWFSEEPEITVTRNRFFFKLSFRKRGKSDSQTDVFFISGEGFEEFIRETIHVPGLRGNPERTYVVAAVGKTFPGTFENYAASIIAKWQSEDDNENLEGVSQDLKELGLTWKVSATPLNDTQVELQVARLPQESKSKASEMVSIADVGFGVSQTLPVVVALREAKPGQLVYLEQPEIHLHPRAQTAMAKVLADAARRGVHVVAETHSSLLILGIQTLVAEGKLSSDLVKLHWFELRNGVTRIRSADLDNSGSFGDWPEDFDDIELEAQRRYLDAVEARVTAKNATEKKRRAG
ncbi:MAG TPA: AAA family ATPase [Pyrinomonadaceae bacterium]|jgi:predicted ATPase|nr:AAA family ATPase [Pyrinomonadaceae bacterium]